MPKAYRFDTQEVFIERKGDLVILHPKHDKDQWWQTVEKRWLAFEDMPDAIACHRGPLADDIESLGR